MNKKFGSFSSSIDPQKLSATVEGAIMTVSSLIIFVAAWKGIQVDQNQILAFAQNAGATAAAFGTAIGLGYSLFGILRKIVVKLTTTTPAPTV